MDDANLLPPQKKKKIYTAVARLVIDATMAPSHSVDHRDT
jgi:hypothetical protein